MHQDGQRLILSPTDLSASLACRHRVALDHLAAIGELERPQFKDPLLKLLFERGLEHEQSYVDSLRRAGKSVTDLSADRDPARVASATVEAMRRGEDVIVQGAVLDDHWYGRPDILERVVSPSGLGDWSYEVTDTKLARETRAGTILQLSLYSDLVGGVQGSRPELFHVVTPDPIRPRVSYRIADFGAYFRQVRDQLLGLAGEPPRQVYETYYPEPTDICDICVWASRCRAKRREDDDLALVAGLSRLHRRELTRQRTTTVTSLAALALPIPFKPSRGAVESYERIREQARLQVASRGTTAPAHEWLTVEPGFGLARLPEPTAEDLFLDLEGDLFAREGGREYLFGLVDAAEPVGYEGLWAFDDASERAVFERVVDRIMAARARNDLMHVYHYAPYEPSAFKRLMGRYASREAELDQLLRESRFVDLYGVVRQGVRVGVERYSIKNLEPLYAFERAVPLEDASRALRAIEVALESHAADLVPREIAVAVEGYNRDDCVSTRRLRDWLEARRRELIANGVDVPRPGPAKGEQREPDERALAVEALREKLVAGVPDTREGRTPQQHGRWLLAYLLDWHRREDKSVWWEYFRLRDLHEEDLFDEPRGVAGLELVERVDEVRTKKGKPTGSVIDRYRLPPQELDLRPGDELKLRDGSKWGTVETVDREAWVIDVKKGPGQASNHPTSAFAHSYFNTEVLQDALFGIGERVLRSGTLSADDGQPDRAGRDLLLGASPRMRSGSFDGGDTTVDAACRLVLELDDSLLGIQGPPGAGKTYTAARMICALVRAGRRVGVTAVSHKVIQNLLEAVAEAAVEGGIAAPLGHRGGDEPEGGPIAVYGDNEGAARALGDREVVVMGGTPWLWSRTEFSGSVDVLFVDEAGQMSLANALAISPAARSLVLLGDPRQLEQPGQGSHPDGVDVSALEHLLGGAGTMPRERGLFLPVTWRLAPAICDYTSEVFYEGKLSPADGLAKQEVLGAGELGGAGLRLVAVEHDGNRNASDEEVDAVEELVRRLTSPGVKWRGKDGQELQMTGAGILVVAPYNAQVSRLQARLDSLGVSVGTVDKFQGREAPVVIYSMGTSRPEDAPRGLEFLYSLNRLNVATSRARCLAILVASMGLFEPECRSPHQMRLANALCRFRELGTQVAC